jgi:hypothetical protein
MALSPDDVKGKIRQMKKKNTTKISKKEKKEELSEDIECLTPIKLFFKAKVQIKQLVISQENTQDVYVVIDNNGTTEAFSLSSQRALYWLRNLALKEGVLFSDSDIKTVREQIKADAHMNKYRKVKIHNRIAFDETTLYYDLALSINKVVRVDENGIKFVSMSSDIPLFRRTQRTFEQTVPKLSKPDALSDLAKLMRVKDRHLFEVHLVSMFLEGIVSPIMFFGGPPGTLKSTNSGLVKMLIDPNGVSIDDNLNSLPPKADDMSVTLYNRYMTAYNNISKVSQVQSDGLCCAVTGGSNDKRKLYTDMDETVMNFKRKIIINGVSPYMEYSDLLDRILSHDREPIGNVRKTDEYVLDRFQRLRPYVLGNVFQIIQKAIKIYKDLKYEISPKTRLASFEVWGEAISRAMGYEPDSFLQKYHEKIKEQSAINRESYPLIRPIEHLLSEQPEWEGSLTELYQVLKNVGIQIGIDVKSPHEGFPKSVSALSRELTKITPILEKLGIIASKYPYTISDNRYPKNTSMVRLSNSECSEAIFSSSVDKIEE